MGEAYRGHKNVYHVFYQDKHTYNPVYFCMVKAIMEKNQNPQDVMGDIQKKQMDVLRSQKHPNVAINPYQKEMMEHYKNIEENIKN